MKKVTIKEDKAVSPIIATILLVAITVVLAATLYTILGGYTTFLGASTPQASINVDPVGTTADPVYTMYVQQFGGNISLGEVQMVITSTNNSVYYTTLGNDLNHNGNVSGLWNVTVSGSAYFTASSVVFISSILSSKGDHNISRIQLVDLDTNGVMGYDNLNQNI